MVTTHGTVCAGPVFAVVLTRYPPPQLLLAIVGLLIWSPSFYDLLRRF